MSTRTRTRTRDREAETADAVVPPPTSFQHALDLVQGLRVRDVRRAFQLMHPLGADSVDVLLVPFGVTCGEFAVAHVLCRR